VAAGDVQKGGREFALKKKRSEEEEPNRGEVRKKSSDKALTATGRKFTDRGLKMDESQSDWTNTVLPILVEG